VSQLAHAGRPGADAGEIKYGKAGQGLRGTRESHSNDSTQDSRQELSLGQFHHKFNS
jgi:hypothetical protein